MGKGKGAFRTPSTTTCMHTGVLATDFHLPCLLQLHYHQLTAKVLFGTAEQRISYLCQMPPKPDLDRYGPIRFPLARYTLSCQPGLVTGSPTSRLSRVRSCRVVRPSFHDLSGQSTSQARHGRLLRVVEISFAIADWPALPSGSAACSVLAHNHKTSSCRLLFPWLATATPTVTVLLPPTFPSCRRSSARTILMAATTRAWSTIASPPHAGPGARYCASGPPRVRGLRGRSCGRRLFSCAGI